MQSIRQVISQVKNKLNAVKLDDRISNKLIYHTLMNYAELLIKRDSDSRKIFKNSGMIVLPEPIELEEIDHTVNSLGIVVPKCKLLKKSINRLPAFFISAYQFPLISVSSIDESTQFDPTTQWYYSQTLNREFRGKKQYFWIEDGYLVIPNEDIDQVKVKGYFSDYITPSLNNACKTKLDVAWSVPDYLSADIIRLTIEDLLVSKKIVKDENSDLNNNRKQ